MEMKQQLSTEKSVDSNGSKFKYGRNRDIEEACTKDGSLDWHGKPASKGNTGGWKSGILLLANEGLATLAFAAVEVNMVLFSKAVLRQTNAEAANTFSMWMGAVHIFSLMGAFLSDSYFGRYLTCLIFQVVLTIGLISLSLSTHAFLLKPKGCGKIGEQCDPHLPYEVALFYISVYLIALGNGASEPALATFGADQFDEEDPQEKHSKTTFFSYFYVALNLGSLIAETIVVYIENMGNWVLGFWISTCCGVTALGLIVSGTYRYRHFKPCGNPISRFSQVMVASTRKTNVKVPSNGEGLYEDHGAQSGNGSMRRIYHTGDFKFLDRAAIITQPDLTSMPNKVQSQNPWKLCSVTQVEEVKCVLRLLPIWFCTILSSVVFIQMQSLFIEQGAAMNTLVFSSFHIPPASMTSFDIISTSIFIMCYEKLIVPLYVRITKREPNPPSELKRMGIGLAITILALITAGVVEHRRLSHAGMGLSTSHNCKGFGSPGPAGPPLQGSPILDMSLASQKTQEQPCSHANRGTRETSSLSIFWQTPQYILVGVSEAFIYVAQMEFFSSQTPDGLKSLGIGLSMSSSAIGSYLCSFLLTVVMKITTRNGKPGWVPPNLNDGHLDRFFYLSACLVAVNLGFYVVCAKRYKGIDFEKRVCREEMEVI